MLKILRFWRSGKQATKIEPAAPDYREEMLLAGEVKLSSWANIAPGTPGYALFELEMDGLMTKQTQLERVDPITWDHVTHFKLTPAGKAAQAMLRD